MAEPNLYVVRRCDNFYRFWSDVTEPAPMPNTKVIFDQLTDGSRHSISPDDFEYFDIFAAAPPPGWDRDFIMIGDGWNKDGDYNTAFSKTVLPLPSHQQPGYDTQPGAIEDDPVYRFHPEDWREYHTRYVTPTDFQRGLRPRSAARARRGSE